MITIFDNDTTAELEIREWDNVLNDWREDVTSEFLEDTPAFPSFDMRRVEDVDWILAAADEWAMLNSTDDIELQASASIIKKAE